MRLIRLGFLLIGGGLAALLAARNAVAADPQPYTVQFNSTGNGALNATIRSVSQLQTLRTAVPVSPFALVDRAQQDVTRLQQGPLESFGYYRAGVTITIEGRPLDDPDLPDILQALPKKRSARVVVRIDTGPLYHLGKLTVDGQVSQNALKAFGLKSGAPAVATEVLAAQERLVTALQAEGHAYATVSYVAYLNTGQPLLDISFTAKPGPVYVLGPIRFEGLMRVREAFLRRQLLIHPGDRYDPARIERTRTTLLGLGVFSSVTDPLPPQSAASDGRLPLTFVVVERKRHAVGINPTYSSDLGVIASASWTDRNLFGDAEQLTVKSDVFGIGGNGLATNGVSYDVGAQLLKPDFLHPDQSLQFSLQALKQQLEAYDQVAVTGGATLSRRLSTVWLVSIGATLEEEKVQQNEVLPDCTQAWAPGIIDPATGEPYSPAGSWCHYTLLGLPLSARYDSTDLANPLDDPLHGMRISLSVTPTESLFGHHTRFVVMQANASAYFDFERLGWSAPGDSVLALRALAGQARGAGQFQLPPDQRFYAGGSATVRGYAYLSVGPYFPPPDTPGEYPEGGTGIEAGTVELRQRLVGNLGMAAFIDAGEVSDTAQPFAGTYSVGYGIGPRYYTPVGPIRLDIAFPLRRLPNGDRFEAYIGLGQAF